MPLLTADDNVLRTAARIIRTRLKKKQRQHNLPLAKWWGLHILILSPRPRPMAAEDEPTWPPWEPVNGLFEFRIEFLLMRSVTEQ